jgi:hypothetical protein
VIAVIDRTGANADQDFADAEGQFFAVDRTKSSREAAPDLSMQGFIIVSQILVKGTSRCQM